MTDERLDRLQADLQELGRRLRSRTRAEHDRFNPLAEELADWHGRAREWTGEDRGITLYDSATLIGDMEIGEHTWVGPFTLLDGTGGLRIGHHCSISTGAQILTHDTIRWALSGGELPADRSATSIGDCCFIGTHAVITRLGWMPAELRAHPAVAEMPVVDAGVGTLTDRLRELVQDPGRRAKLGAAARLHVLRWHSYAAVGQTWDAIFDALWCGTPVPREAAPLEPTEDRTR